MPLTPEVRERTIVFLNGWIDCARLFNTDDFIESVRLIAHDDLGLAVLAIYRSNRPDEALRAIQTYFNGLAKELRGAQRLQFRLHGFRALQLAELRHLANELGILLRIERVLGGELRHQQFDKIALIQLLDRHAIGVGRAARAG